MAMKLRIVMYDDALPEHLRIEPSGGIGIELDPRVESRIIQEEVWTQTVWPEGESPLAEMLAQATDPTGPGEAVRRMFLVVRHVPHSPSGIMAFASPAEAGEYRDPDGGTFETVTERGVRRVLGTWATVDPRGLEPGPRALSECACSGLGPGLAYPTHPPESGTRLAGPRLSQWWPGTYLLYQRGIEYFRPGEEPDWLARPGSPPALRHRVGMLPAYRDEATDELVPVLRVPENQA